jgi:hypothetical protein
MDQSRKGGIVKWKALTVMATVLLLFSYVACWGLAYWSDERDTAASGTAVATNWNAPVFAPLHGYCRAEMPAHRTLRIFCAWCYFQGSGSKMPWSYIDEQMPRE